MALELRDVELTLHGRPLVPRLRARVEPGEVLALMGESGSGKSSLLAWMTGLLEPPLAASGRLFVEGIDITGWPTERRRIGLLFQDDLLYPHLTVAENLLFALHEGPRAQRERQCADALQRAGLGGFEGRLPGTLSGGQRARVSLLRALLARPRALLLDEPFGRLDAALRESMREFVWSEMRQQQVCGVLVTHDRQDVPPLAQLIELPRQAAGDA